MKKSYSEFKKLLKRVQEKSPVNLDNETLECLLYEWYNYMPGTYTEDLYQKSGQILSEELEKFNISSEKFYDYYMKWTKETFKI